MTDPVQRTLHLLEHAQRIVERSDLTWKAKYAFIFSDHVSGEIAKLLPSFIFSDPDMDYEDDVRAYVQQLEEFLRPET